MKLLTTLLVAVLSTAPRSGSLVDNVREARPEGATAQDRSLVILDFDVGLTVDEDGDLDVLESIRVEFRGSWNGIFRTIPVEYRLPDGEHTLYVDVESVASGEGEPLEYRVRREGAHKRLRIRVPDARDAVRTVRIRYTVPNALRFFETHEELYWNVTGSRREVEIRRATASVEVPAGVTGLRATAYTGPWGSTAQNARWEKIERGFYFETTQSLGFRDGLTVVVGWDPGLVDRMDPVESAVLFLRANWLLVLLPLISLGIMGYLWYTRGRDPARRSVAPRYEPPDGLSPAEVGTLVDHWPHMRDVTATIVDLAVRGYLRIEEVERSGLAGWLKGSDYEFVRERGQEAWAELENHEVVVLKGIFGYGGERRRLSDLTNEFYEHLEEIRNHIFGRLRRAGYYTDRPDKLKRRYAVTAVIIVVLAGMAATIFLARTALGGQPVLLAGILTALPVFGFGWFMPARTMRGVRKLEEILGFEEFLDKVEQDRYKRMITSPEMFERYLPYAMALGVDERWARAFEDIYTEPPDWYVGAGHDRFRSTLLVSDLGAMSGRAGAVLSSQPRSSGGSGFGGGGVGAGGGFSGGGFGGGSVGGW